MVRQVRDEPRAHRWDRELCNGSENDPKIGGDETLRNFIVARDTRSTLGPGTKHAASWETQETSDASTSPTTGPRRPGRQQIKQFKRQHVFVIINAISGRNSATRDCSSSSSDSRSQKQTMMEGECSCCTCRECVAGSDSETSFQVVHTDQASSWIYDTGRAFTGKATGS